MKNLITKTKNFVSKNKDKIEEGIMIGTPIAIGAALTIVAYKAGSKLNDFNEDLLDDAQQFIESKELDDEFLEFINDK